MLSGLIIAGILLGAMVIIGLIFTTLYRKSTKEMAFVRTGLGGEKVIMNGGAVVLPVLHEIMKVNMNTLKLEVSRANEQALITKDRLRVDVLAEFYVRVALDFKSISIAAQTLGKKTLNPDELKILVEGKFVDSLRSVAAEMEMEELHEKRADFVQRVQSTVNEDLKKNGLELESVSLTGLDQTDKDYFNPDNVFDAQGLKKITEATEERRKERNEIERDTALSIQKKDLETEKESLSLKQEEEWAKLDQKREIAKKTASQEAEIKKEQSEKFKEAESVRIAAEEEIQKQEIQKAKMIEEKEIEKQKVVEEKEIEKQRAVEEKEIEKEKAVKIAEQDKQIAINEKYKEESLAKKEANEAKALEVDAEQKAITAEQKEIYVRNKELAIIKAEEDAQKERTRAKGEADAIITVAEAKEKEYSVEAEAKENMNNAENLLSPEIIEMRIKEAMIQNLPKIVEQVVKPMENIDSIKVVDVNGMGAGNSGTLVDGAVASKSLPDQVVDAALRHRTQLPIINDLMGQVGFDMNSVANMVGSMEWKEAPSPKK